MRNCSCSNKARKNKDGIRKRAIRFAVVEETDVQIYTWTEAGYGRLWDFEPAGYKDRGIGLVEIIKFRDHKSEDVLPDTEEFGQDNEQDT